MLVPCRPGLLTCCPPTGEHSLFTYEPRPLRERVLDLMTSGKTRNPIGQGTE